MKAIQFEQDTNAFVIERPAFGLVLTHTGNPTLWAPYHHGSGSAVAVAGRPVLDEAEWQLAETLSGMGGLAAKLIHRRFQEQGPTALEHINGNCAVVAYDNHSQTLFLVTEPSGTFPVFEVTTPDGHLYCSHPDTLATIANERGRIDELSLAEFILFGTVTPPYSYYKAIRGSVSGTVFSHRLEAGRAMPPARRRHFDFAYRGDPRIHENELAEHLATAIGRAVERRTLPRLGRAAIALSGGLDSRVILASALGADRLLAFSCFDEPNRELRTAEAIARVLDVPFLPLKRGAEYYAENAEQGVRLSGGMGSLANNHFLGVIPRLKAEGVGSLLTGCYCDYLFKGLSLNRQSHWLTRREAVAPFRSQFYSQHFAASTPLAEHAMERWESRIPHQWRCQSTAQDIFQVETSRIFPLCYERDNQQRVVPQRVIGWSSPFVDREILEFYKTVPYTVKLNKSLFRKVVSTLGSRLEGIADANTGSHTNASAIQEWLSSNRMRLQRKLSSMRGARTSDGSWPDWNHYVVNSPILAGLWSRQNPDAIAFFQHLLGRSLLPPDVDALKREQPFLFARLLTVKLWLDARK